MDGILTQPTHDEHEDEVAELKLAINMSLGQSNAEVCKYRVKNSQHTYSYIIDN
jgi:hypothetical protein